MSTEANSAGANVTLEPPSTSSSVATATDSKKPDTQEKTFTRYRSLIIAECGLKVTTNENYLKRLQNLRNELNYINETEWMYESLDKPKTTQQ